MELSKSYARSCIVFLCVLDLVSGVYREEIDTKGDLLDRAKRTIHFSTAKGLQAVKALLSGSKPLKTKSTTYRKYEKYGGFLDALKDFYSVQPRHIKVLQKDKSHANYKSKMYLPIGFAVLVLCALSNVQCHLDLDGYDDDVRIVKRSSMIALGKAVMQRLTQSSVKYQAHSSETVTKWGKLGGWNAAKNDFRDIVKQAAPGSVKTLTDASGRRVIEMRARVGDRHIHLLRDGYNGHPTMQVTDHLVHKAHVDEFIYKP